MNEKCVIHSTHTDTQHSEIPAQWLAETASVPILDYRHRLLPPNRETVAISNLQKERADVFFNCCIKHYPNYQMLTIADSPIFKEKGWELREKTQFKPKPQNKNNEPNARSVTRAQNKVFDIAILNNFDYFVTLTFSSEFADRYSAKDTSKIAKQFFQHQANRNNIYYLLVPEYHKDGAIHIHGLVSGKLDLVNSGHKTADGKVIYNWNKWTCGFSTCIAITGNAENVAKYITKYINKDFRKIFGNFYYAGGKGLVRNPDKTYLNADFDTFNLPIYTVDNIGLQLKYARLEGAPI